MSGAAATSSGTESASAAGATASKAAGVQERVGMGAVVGGVLAGLML